MGVTVVPLLDEPIPESFSVLQDVVRETAELYVQDKKKPILTRKEYMYVSLAQVLLCVGFLIYMASPQGIQ